MLTELGNGESAGLGLGHNSDVCFFLLFLLLSVLLCVFSYRVSFISSSSKFRRTDSSPLSSSFLLSFFLNE